MRFLDLWLLVLLVSAMAVAQTGTAPLTLEQVLAEALANNRTLLAERFNISVGQARILQASLRPNPVLSVEANYLDLLGSGFDPARSAAGPTEANARVDFLIERGAKRRNRIDVAEAEKAVAQLELLELTRTLVLDVQSTFTEVLLAKQSLAIATESLEAFNRVVAINRVRVDSGDLARVELVRSEVAALQFRNQVRQAELRLRLTKNRLQTLMGRRSMDPFFDVSGDMRADFQQIRREQLLQDAMDSRPDLEALRRDQARSLAEIRLQVAQGKMDLTVGAGYNRQLNVGAGQRGDSIGLFLSVPLPFTNRNQGEIERARQQSQQVEARIRALEQQIESEVASAYDQYLTARELLQSIERDMLDQATRVREVIGFSYQRGEATFVELLDAQRTFNETRQALVDAKAEYARSLFLIDAISGKRVAN